MRRPLLVTVAAIAISALAVLAVDPVRDALGHLFRGDVDALRAELRGLGATGVAVLVGLILVHAVVFFPAEILNAAAGLVYGFEVAFPIVIVAWVVSGLLAYWLGAAAGRPVAVRLAGAERVALAERVIERGGATALLLARLVPLLPFSLVGYIAGAAHVPVWRYTWTTFVGTVPITAAATYVGHAIEDFSLTDPLLWVALAILALLALSTVWAGRRWRRARPPGD